MKKIVVGMLLLILAAIPASSRAQLMKKLLANAQNTITGHSSANGKKDSAQSKQDSAALAQRMSQLMTAQPKKGPSVSPADSAAAIRSFKTATGGDGQYYAFLETYTFTNKKGKDSVFRDTMYICLSDAHFYRNNFSMLGAKMVMLGRGSMPLYSVHLETEAKTYSLHIIDTAALNRGDGMTYQVTRVGAEKVNGYDCVHARLTISKPGSKLLINEDVWTSNSVPGYATFKSLATPQNVSVAFMKALDQAGCGGFAVKVSVSGAAYSMTAVLVQATRKNFSASDFEIPSGYVAETVAANPLGGMFKQ